MGPSGDTSRCAEGVEDAADRTLTRSTPREGNAKPYSAPITVRVNGGVPSGAARVIGSPTSGHNVGDSGASVSPGNSGTTGLSSQTTRTTPLDQSRDQSSSHVTDLSHMSHLSQLSHLSPILPADLSRNSQKLPASLHNISGVSRRLACGLPNELGPVARSALSSLGLLCLTSLLLALLALTFLVEIKVDGPSSSSSGRRLILVGGSSEFEDEMSPQEVTLALAALTIVLNLCCLLICCSQFIFALKLVKSEDGERRLLRYLHQLSLSRVFAVGIFFISIPVLLTAVILYTFSHFQRTPAILTATVIGVGVLVCGVAMVHSVFVWQKEKSRREPNQLHGNARLNLHNGLAQPRVNAAALSSSPLPNATLDLSRGQQPVLELSTLV